MKTRQASSDRKRRTRQPADEILTSMKFFVKKLNDECENGALIVVEGRRDEEALRAVGFKGVTYTLSHNGSFARLLSVSEAHSKVILLLDYDAKGRIMTGRANLILRGRARTDVFFRRELASLTKGRVKRIEELTIFADYLQPLNPDGTHLL